jgi:hypothetical protein
MTAFCAFLPSHRRTFRSPVARRRLRFFRLFNRGREPQRGSAHAADLSPGSRKPLASGTARGGLAPEFASSPLNAPRASARKPRISSVPLAARRSAPLQRPVEAAALLAFRRRLLPASPRPRSGEATRRPAQRDGSRVERSVGLVCFFIDSLPPSSGLTLHDDRLAAGIDNVQRRDFRWAIFSAIGASANARSVVRKSNSQENIGDIFGSTNWRSD